MSEPADKGLQPWRVMKSRYVVKSPWMNLREDACETAEGVTIDPFYVLESVDFVHIVPFDREGHLLITRQYRHGNEDIHWEIPCGCVDPQDASPLAAAQRELLEETGCTAERYVELPKIYANPARQNNRIHTFLAFNAEVITEPAPDPSERIEFQFVEVAAVLEKVRQGEFPNALIVASVMMALSRQFH